MRTITTPRPFVAHPHFASQRRAALAGLDPLDLDPPLITLVKGFNQLPYYFTLQCCWGLFQVAGQRDPHNLNRLPPGKGASVHYRIAYLALCIESNPSGLTLRTALERLPALDPDYIEFCSADWFWKRWPNLYALQVEPLRFRHLDAVDLPYQEALHVQDCRDRFFTALDQLLAELLKVDG